jgi:hypothetical protein
MRLGMQIDRIELNSAISYPLLFVVWIWTVTNNSGCELEYGLYRITYMEQIQIGLEAEIM